MIQDARSHEIKIWYCLLLSETFVVMHLNCDTGTGQQLDLLHVNWMLTVTTTMMMIKVMMMMMMLLCSLGRRFTPCP
jgi:hypothetical protein